MESEKEELQRLRDLIVHWSEATDRSIRVVPDAVKAWNDCNAANAAMRAEAKRILEETEETV